MRSCAFANSPWQAHVWSHTAAGWKKGGLTSRVSARERKERDNDGLYKLHKDWGRMNTLFTESWVSLIDQREIGRSPRTEVVHRSRENIDAHRSEVRIGLYASNRVSERATRHEANNNNEMTQRLHRNSPIRYDNFSSIFGAEAEPLD